MTAGVIEAYETEIAAGRLKPDPAQRRIAAVLDQLARELDGYTIATGRGGLFGLIRGRTKKTPPAGLYIQGDVGRGKTMLMDLFFAHAEVDQKRRVHFHAFMQETHARIHRLRQAHTAGDPVKPAAAEIAGEASLLCFDEFQVTDIADAMILGRLFEALFEEGVVVVATSNVLPRDLYRHGLNRNAFVPFIRLIEQRLVVETLAGAIDYRLDRIAGEPVYFTPLGPAADAAVQSLWERLTDTKSGEPLTLVVKGRNLLIPQAAKQAARFSFDELCARPLGPADYLAIAAVFDTVFVERVPALTPEHRNEARRFVTFIDTLYDRQIRLVMSAATEPEAIYADGDGAFAFARTVSRLNEMMSAGYWSAGPDRARAAILT
jgi:cell division protein ZapE